MTFYREKSLSFIGIKIKSFKSHISIGFRVGSCLCRARMSGSTDSIEFARERDYSGNNRLRCQLYRIFHAATSSLWTLRRISSHVHAMHFTASFKFMCHELRDILAPDFYLKNAASCHYRFHFKSLRMLVIFFDVDFSESRCSAFMVHLVCTFHLFIFPLWRVLKIMRLCFN